MVLSHDPTSRISASVVCLALAVVFAVGAAAPAQGFNPGKKCGSFKESAYRTVVYRKGSISCSGAVRVVRSFRTHNNEWKQHGDGSLATTYWTKHGWKCAQGSGAGSCRKRGKGHLFYEVLAARVSGARDLVVAADAAAPRCSVEAANGCKGERGCGKTRSGGYRLKVWTKGPNCHTGKKVARRSVVGSTVAGWVCLGSDVGALCRPPGKSGLHRPYIRYSVLNPSAKAAVRSARRGTKKCGSYKARGVRWTTTAEHLSCHKANKISKAVNKNVNQSQIVFHNDGTFSHKKFPSFRCDTGALGGFCRDGRHVVGWSGIPLRGLRGAQPRMPAAAL